MVRMIVNLDNGDVLPLYAADAPVPDRYVEVPLEIYRKWVADGAKDGLALAKSILLGEVPKVSKRTVSTPAEPSFPSVTRVPTGGTLKV